MKISTTILFVIIIFSIGPLASYSATTPYSSLKPNGGITAVSLKEKVTRDLRLAIMADKQLSSNAHNVKIIAPENANAIILEGHVASRSEKVRIENLARARAGKMKVFNRLTY